MDKSMFTMSSGSPLEHPSPLLRTYSPPIAKVRPGPLLGISAPLPLLPLRPYSDSIAKGAFSRPLTLMAHSLPLPADRLQEGGDTSSTPATKPGIRDPQ